MEARAGGVGIRGTGDARHHDAGDDGRVAEAALEVADKALCPVDEDVGDAGLLHQVPASMKKGTAMREKESIPVKSFCGMIIPVSEGQRKE